MSFQIADVSKLGGLSLVGIVFVFFRISSDKSVCSAVTSVGLELTKLYQTETYLEPLSVLSLCTPATVNPFNVMKVVGLLIIMIR